MLYFAFSKYFGSIENPATLLNIESINTKSGFVRFTLELLNVSGTSLLQEFAV
jgi:hypothetical protein